MYWNGKRCFNFLPKGFIKLFCEAIITRRSIIFIDFKDLKSSDSVISLSHLITYYYWSFGRGKSSKRETFCFETERLLVKSVLQKSWSSVPFNFFFIFNKCTNELCEEKRAFSRIKKNLLDFSPLSYHYIYFLSWLC